MPVGAAEGKIPARLNPAASAGIVLDDTDSENSANRVLAITATTPPGEAIFSLIPSVDFRNILWFEAKVKVAATEEKSQFADLDGMLLAFVKEAENTGRFYAYDGKQGLANGSGTWKSIGEAVAPASWYAHDAKGLFVPCDVIAEFAAKFARIATVRV